MPNTSAEISEIITSIAITMLGTAQGVAEEMGGVEEAIWESVIEDHQLWRPLGEKEQVKMIMEYVKRAG